jgi:hypothetical protein
MSNDEKMEHLIKILYDREIRNEAKFEQMEEVLWGGKDE